MQTKEELLKRLESKTVKLLGCWLYQGAQSKKGYCQAQFNGKQFYVHRLSAHIHWGFDLNSPMQILHDILCVNPNCWNPDHLREGTPEDNVQDAIITSTHKNILADLRRQKTHCPQEHEYSEENTGFDSNGGRYCKTCNRENARLRSGYYE